VDKNTVINQLLSSLNSSWLWRVAVGVILGALLLGLGGLRREPPEPARAVWPVGAGAPHPGKLERVAQGVIPMPAGAVAAHASTLVVMPAPSPVELMAFWFAGSREGAADVQIAAAQFDRATQRWSEAKYVVNRHEMGAQLGHGIRRLGNPVAWLDSQNKIHLFVVATGWGGWSAGRILHLRQTGDAQDVSMLKFEPARVMPLSWLWNTSFLVRSAPLPLADGGMVLPAYFELGMKYAVNLRFDADGHFKGMVRISPRRHLLQPTLLMKSESNWLALMRDNRGGGNVAVAETRNGGQDWVDVPDLPLLNHDTSAVGISLAPNQMLLAHNSSPHARNVLDLNSSQDGRVWPLVETIASGGEGSEYSYPALAWVDGSLWLSYTDQRRRIAWQQYRFGTAQDNRAEVAADKARQ
jgi:predicted neuraminidase